MFVNPMYEGLQNKIKYMWPEATLAPFLDFIWRIVTLGFRSSINDIDIPWVNDLIKVLAQKSAFNISELGKLFLFLSLAVYACSLLLRMLHQCCKDGDIPDINYASYAKELAQSPTEDVPDLIKKIKQKERDMTGEAPQSTQTCLFLANFLIVIVSSFFPRFCMSPSRGASPPSGADGNMELLELHNM